MTLAKARIKNPRYWSKLQPRGSNLVGARRTNVRRPKAPWSLLSSTFAQGRLTWRAGWRGQTMLTPNTKQKPNLRSLYTDHNRSGRAGPGCSGHAARAGGLARPDLLSQLGSRAPPAGHGARRRCAAKCGCRCLVPLAAVLTCSQPSASRGWALVLRVAPSHSWSLREGGTENKGSPDGYGLVENQYL